VNALTIHQTEAWNLYINKKVGCRIMRGAVKNTIKILTIEDDTGQVEALKEALTVAQIICVEIHEAADGEQAMTFLNQEFPFMDAPQPDLIFLSNHLPDMSGEDIIKGLQRDRRLQTIPVALFSEKPPRESDNFSFPSNCHMFKRPVTCDEWIYVLRCIEDVWITLLNMSGKPHI
jgi:chemotaxis family two-component system response regulator Rcp1